MINLKIGDKVRCIEEVDKHKVGNIINVIALDSDGDPILSGDTEQDTGWSCWREYFKPCYNEAAPDKALDSVNHPKHYTNHPSGIECIQITEHMNFNLGNALKYIWRADLKNDAIEDLQKAAWYINRELKRRGGEETGE